MSKRNLLLMVLAITILPFAPGHGQDFSQLTLHYADNLEVVPSRDARIWYANGSVVFETKNGFIYCDSAVWFQGRRVKLKGSVIIDDPDYRLAADSVDYDQVTNEAVARGDYVELWSRPDSIFAVGRHAYHDRNTNRLYMEERPTLFLKYPDTASMVQVVADYIDYDGGGGRAEAFGDVQISSQQISADAGCAVMNPDGSVLDLFEDPVATHGQSEVSGSLISVYFVDNVISGIDVIDSARAHFNQAKEPLSDSYDQSILQGDRILFDFDLGELSLITCYGQAYSWYLPDDRGQTETSENSVSGDTISFDIDNESLMSVNVVGGAIGTYLNSKYRIREKPPDTLADTTTAGDTLPLQNTEVMIDTMAQPTDDIAIDTLDDSVADSVTLNTIDTITDTIEYQADIIRYSLIDSIISLDRQADVKSGSMSLTAHRVEIDNKTNVVEAFSADIVSDSAAEENTMISQLQPNPIPVVLQDKGQMMYGDYLEYSIDTEKGRIVQSKSEYETGYYYGEKVFRETEDVFYMHDGRYTTCDAEEPHFHFYSKDLKLMQGEKLVARPVIMHIGRIPIIPIPYYVFPLKRGRHSGFLTFTIGNLERGERYIRNVGYYWAASEYWDWLNALDYYDQNDRLNLHSKVAYNKRYHFSGSVTGNYARETIFNSSTSTLAPNNRWTLSVAHRHDLSPSFKIDGSGSIQSDKSYYQDFSTDLNERLNRNVRSQVNFSKRFSSSVAISGKVSHDENLDTETRTDQFPSVGLSLPQFRPFGSPKRNDLGELEERWYQNLVATYRPNLLNYSQRILKTENFIDSSFVTDTITGLPDTLVDTTSISYRSRKGYTRLNHALTVSFPVKFVKYITFNPSIRYNEEWYKVYATDQSRDVGINTSATHRARSWSTGANLSTKLYGTIYPNAFGLVGFRQVLTPTVSYAYTPNIRVDSEVPGFAGGSIRTTTRSQNVGFSLSQVYQVKVKSGEAEKNLQLVSITSNFNYNLEAEEQPFSLLTTSYQSNALPKISFYGSVVHSLYKPGTNEVRFWSPYKQSFTFNASFTLGGRRFLFDDVSGAVSEPASDTARPGIPGVRSERGPGVGSGGWSFSANYSYRESGRGETFNKSSFFKFSAKFKLTPETDISYSQYYDISRSMTINNQVEITRRLHCWTATFFWVPVGSNRGFGFQIYVTALPEVKLDQSENTFSSGYFQGLGR